MRVCLITSTYPRYDEDTVPAFVHELAKEIVRPELEVHVLAPHHAVAKREEILDGVFIHRFRYMLPAKLETLAGDAGMPSKIQNSLMAKIEMLLYLLSSFIDGLQICKKHKIDVFHAHWFFPSGFVGVFLKELTHRPLIVSGYGVEFFLTKRRYRWLSFLLRWIAANADACAFNSEATKTAAASIGVIKGATIYYGINTGKFYPMPPGDGRVKAVREKFKIPKGKIILSVGRLVERKGFRYLIESMPSVLKKIDVVLVIAGAGPERKLLEALVHQLGIEDQVRLVSNVSPRDLPTLYNACDLFVLPSIVDSAGDQEGLGIVLCEAMSCKKPVIGTRVGGISEVICDGYNGVLIEQKSVEQLSNAIIKIMSDDKFARRLGINGRVSILKKFSYEEAAKTYVSIYRSVATMK